MSTAFFSEAVWNSIIAHSYNLLLYLVLMEKKLELCCDLPEMVLLLKLVLFYFLLSNQEIDA
jgi:hypothetical protein